MSTSKVKFASIVQFLQFATCVQTNQAGNTVMNSENENAYPLLPTQTKLHLDRIQTGRRKKKVGSDVKIYRLAKSTSCLNSKITAAKHFHATDKKNGMTNATN